MSKLVISLIVAGLVVVGGGAAYVLMSGDDENDEAATSQSNEADQSESENSEATSEFAPVSTDGVAFVATIKTAAGGQNVNATMEYDGEANYRYKSVQQGQNLEVITTPEASYMKLGNQGWFKYASGTNQANVNTDDYQYDEAKLADYKANSTYKGTGSCIAGTCDIWEVTSAGSGTATIYLDSSNQRIVQVKTTINNTQSTITYDYKSVKITPPANAKTFPNYAQ